MEVTVDIGKQAHKKIAVRADWANEHFQISMMASSLHRDEYSVFFDEYIESVHSGGGAAGAENNQQDIDNILLDIKSTNWQII